MDGKRGYVSLCSVRVAQDRDYQATAFLSGAKIVSSWAEARAMWPYLPLWCWAMRWSRIDDGAICGRRDDSVGGLFRMSRPRCPSGGDFNRLGETAVGPDVQVDRNCHSVTDGSRAGRREP